MSDAVCNHIWRIYDVYCIAPNFGNQICELCGLRQKGVALSDQQVKDYIDRTQDRYALEEKS